MTALVILTSVLAVWFTLLGTGKILGLPAMAERAAHAGFTVGAYRVIGVLELAGVISLFTGWAVTGIGVAAATGFLLLLTGAALAHLRAGDRLPALAPAIVSAALVAAYLIVLL
ncbi:DoxX family protein [Streptomyces fulvoviolaceus]|uniref:DoxX family protein n=1 Tax=Streptomyces fulvoviolaceus TaxID=285535 RepID=UPI0004C887BF|nr:DoxX family protein [Streptomyces fulvoviolaceus]